MFTSSGWDPFASAFAFERPFFEPFLRRGARVHEPARQAPHVDITETEQAFTLTVDLPGVLAKDVALNVDEQVLSLRAERSQNVPEGYRAHRLERSTFALSQRFALPRRLDLENVRAELKSGVLTVTLPKLAEVGPRTITVQSASESVQDTSSPASLASTVTAEEPSS